MNYKFNTPEEWLQPLPDDGARTRPRSKSSEEFNYQTDWLFCCKTFLKVDLDKDVSVKFHTLF